MEEKKVKIGNSLWSVSSNGNFNKLTVWIKDHSCHHAFTLLRREKGFTLIELLIVVAVIGVLATSLVLLLDPQKQLAKSRDGTRKTDLKQIQTALELYYADTNTYPSEASRSVAICSSTSLASPCASPDVVYMQNVPKDPSTNGHYYYCTASCGAPANGYVIYSCIENDKDADALATTQPSNAIKTSMGCPSGSIYFRVINP